MAEPRRWGWNPSAQEFEECYERPCGWHNQHVEDPKVITIEVFGGVVSDVKGLPEDWTYKVLDLDVEKVR